MARKSSTKRKRYRWTPDTAPERFEALSKARKRDFKQAFLKVRRGGLSLRRAAKEQGIDRENFTAYVKAFGDVDIRPGRRARIVKDNRPVTINIITREGEVEIKATGEEAYLTREHRKDLNAARKRRDRSLLEPWRGKVLKDREGNSYELLSSLDRFFELFPPDAFNPASTYA